MVPISNIQSGLYNIVFPLDRACNLNSGSWLYQKIKYPRLPNLMLLLKNEKTDPERKCKRAMYDGMSHELSHLLPFKTLMKKITINAAFLWGDFITNVILFKEILLELYRPASKWFSVYLPWFNVVLQRSEVN